MTNKCPYCRKRQGWHSKSALRFAWVYVLLLFVILVGIIVLGILPVSETVMIVGALGSIAALILLVCLRLGKRIRNAGKITPECVPTLEFTDSLL